MKKSLINAAAMLVIAASAGALAAGSSAPRPPCGAGDPLPAYGEARAPSIETWSRLSWQAPACLGWNESHFKFVIAVAGRVEAADAASLLMRLGAISTSRGMLYWSVTENAWRVLIKDASALSGAQGSRRDDFTGAELREGATVYFVEQDNRSDEPVTYAMRVRESKPDRIVVETENVTPVKASLVTLLPPGSMRTAYFATRMDSRTWGFYVISAAGDRASSMVTFARTSYENRARALFAHFAGVEPTHDK